MKEKEEREKKLQWVVIIGWSLLLTVIATLIIFYDIDVKNLNFHKSITKASEVYEVKYDKGIDDLAILASTLKYVDGKVVFEDGGFVEYFSQVNDIYQRMLNNQAEYINLLEKHIGK